MNGNITHTFDYWTDQFAHLLILNFFMNMIIRTTTRKR